MKEATPQWITGTLYSSSQLQIFLDNGDVLIECTVWVQLRRDRLQWEIAFPTSLATDDVYNSSYSGRLSQIHLTAEHSSAPVSIEEVRFEEYFLSDEQGFDGWEQATGTPANLNDDFALMKLSVQNGHQVTALAQQHNIYARRLQFPSTLQPCIKQCISLPNRAALYFSCETTNGTCFVSLWSFEEWKEYEAIVTLALELLAGAPSQMVQRIWDLEHAMFLVSPYLPLPLPGTYLGYSTRRVLPHLIHCLSQLSTADFKKFRISSRQHLFAKACAVPMETRYAMEMTWIDMLDGSYQLSFPSTAKLLGIGEAGAEMIQEVRNKLIHDSASLPDAIELAVEKIFSPERRIDRKPAPILTPRDEHLSLITDQLGISQPPSAPAFPGQIVQRLTERIDTAIWNFLGIPANGMRRFLEWPEAASIPQDRLPDFLQSPPFPMFQIP